MAQWFYKSADGRKVGPLSTADLEALVESGMISPQTLVTDSTSFEWVAASSVEGLFQRRPQAADGRRAACRASPIESPKVAAKVSSGVHPLTWMAIGGGAVAVATLAAALLGFFRGPVAQPAPTAPIAAGENSRSASARAEAERPIAASMQKPLTIPPTVRHPKIRDDVPAEIHSARFEIDRFVADHGVDPTKWLPWVLSRAQELSGQIKPWTKQLSKKVFRNPEEIAAEVSPSVVTVEVTKENYKVTGSGFIVGADGMIATNFHVIQGAKKAKIVFDDGKGADVDGFFAVAPGKDLALLHVNPPSGGLKVLALAKQRPVTGAAVFAFGSPLGLRGSMVPGTVEAVQRGDEIPYHDVDMTWIQSNAQISPGNSGGPLVNANCEVVGVNTLKVVGETQLNFAVSALDVAGLIGERSKSAQSLDGLPRSRVEGQIAKEDFGKEHAQPGENADGRLSPRRREAAVVARNILHFYGSVEKMPPRIREGYEQARETAGDTRAETDSSAGPDPAVSPDHRRRENRGGDQH
jgi:S1-C subfamily serine protease